MDSPIFDSLIDALLASVDKQKAESASENILAEWVSDTIRNASLGLFLNEDGVLTVSLWTQDDLNFKWSFDEVIGVGLFGGHEDDRRKAEEIAEALRAAANRLTDFRS